MNNVSKFVIGSLGLVFLFLVGCKKEEVQVVDYRARDSKIIRDYLADNSITADSLPSGLYFLIENLGSGKHPNATSSVKIRYTGYLTEISLNGKLFRRRVPGFRVVNCLGSPALFPVEERL